MTSGFSLYLDEVPVPSTTPATVNGKYYHNTTWEAEFVVVVFCFFSLVVFLFSLVRLVLCDFRMV